MKATLADGRKADDGRRIDEAKTISAVDLRAQSLNQRIKARNKS